MIEIDCELYEAEPEVVDYINTLVRELREEREKNANGVWSFGGAGNENN